MGHPLASSEHHLPLPTGTPVLSQQRRLPLHTNHPHTGRSIIRDVTQVDINLALAITLIRRPYILPQLFTTPYREDQPEAEPSLKIVSYSLLLDDLPLEEWCRTGIPPSPSTHTPPATASTP